MEQAHCGVGGEARPVFSSLKAGLKIKSEVRKGSNEKRPCSVKARGQLLAHDSDCEPHPMSGAALESDDLGSDPWLLAPCPPCLPLCPQVRY